MAETLSICLSVVGIMVMNFTITTTNPWFLITALGMVCLTAIVIVRSWRSDSNSPQRPETSDQKQIEKQNEEKNEKQNEEKKRESYVSLHFFIFRPVFFLGRHIVIGPVERFIMCITNREEEN